MNIFGLANGSSSYSVSKSVDEISENEIDDCNDGEIGCKVGKIEHGIE